MSTLIAQVKQLNHFFGYMHSSKLKHQGIFLDTEIQLLLMLGF